MKTDIKKISSDDFFRFYGSEAALADYYVRRLKSTDGVLSIFMDSKPSGYIIYHSAGKESVTIKYIFVLESYRKTGIAKKLLAAAENILEGIATVQIQVPEKTVGFDYLYKFFIKIGYAVNDKMFLFRSEEQDLPRWDKYMEKHGKRLVRWLTEVEGYRAVSLSDAGEDILNAIRESELNSKEPYLITPFLDGTQSDFIPSMSFIALKQDEIIPAAHCIVTAPDNVSAVFSQVFSAETGAMFLPLIMSIKRCKERGYKRSVYAVGEKNNAMMTFANNVLSKITSHKTTQYNFIKIVGDDRK